MHMRGLTALRGLAVACLLVGTLVGAAPAGAMASRQPCQALGASPDFATDHVLFCASGGLDNVNFKGPIRLFRSNDAGHTWDAGSQVVWSNGVDQATAILFSPAFATDHTLFVGTRRSGGFESTDGGRTFKLFSDVSTVLIRSQASPFLDGVTQAGVVTPALIANFESYMCCASVYRGGSVPQQPLVTVPGFQIYGVIAVPQPSPYSAVVIGRSNVSLGAAPYDPVPRAYGCDAHLVCVRELYNFGADPASSDETYVYPEPISERGQDYYAARESFNNQIRLFRSRDAGVTWTPWTSTDRLFRSTHYADTIQIGASPARPHQLFLRVAGSGYTKELDPTEQLFRTDDDGATWTRIGFAWAPGQTHRKPASTLPWNAESLYGNVFEDPQPLVVGPHGELYVVAQHVTGKTVDSRGVYCSKNYGRTWSTRC